jgi:SCP-2 sterol transfer family
VTKLGNDVSAHTPIQFAFVKNLSMDGDGSPEATLKTLASLLKTSSVTGTLQLRILDSAPSKDLGVFRVTFGPTKRKASPKSKANAKTRVELISTSETWIAIASSRLSPIEAFLRGKMRIRGDAVMAQDILEHVAATPGLTHLCGRKP